MHFLQTRRAQFPTRFRTALRGCQNVASEHISERQHAKNKISPTNPLKLSQIQNLSTVLSKTISKFAQNLNSSQNLHKLKIRLTKNNNFNRSLSTLPFLHFSIIQNKQKITKLQLGKNLFQCFERK